jgi:hypothetical protein
MVPTAAAIAHIKSLRDMMMDHWLRYCAKSGEKARTHLSELSLSDADQAILEASLSDPAFNCATDIVSTYLARGISPMGQALSMLAVRSAPTEVSRAALYAMDSQVGAMLAVEPQVVAISEQEQELKDEAAVLDQRERAMRMTYNIAEASFDLSCSSGDNFCSIPITPRLDQSTQLVAIQQANAAAMQALENQRSALGSSMAKLSAQFRAMTLPSVAQLGKSAPPPAPAGALPDDIVPPDAIPD